MANWIAGAIRHKGALTAKAKKAGAVSKKGTIKKGFIARMAKQPGTTGRQGRLAQTLAKLRGS